MPTATKSSPKPKKKPAAPKKVRKARFAAEGSGAIVTMENQDEVVNAKGVKIPIANTGKRIIFKDDGFGGQFYETTDEAEIEFLRQRANMFGVIKEVPIPKPPSAPVLMQIIKLVRAGDVNALVALAEAEEATHEREDVLEAIADALESLKPHAE